MSSPLKTYSYILAVIERGQIADVVKAVKEISQIEEGALLIGKYELLVRVSHYDRSDLYKSVSQIRDTPGIRATSTHIPFEGFTKEYTVDENDALTISLLRAQGSLPDVLSQLKKLEHVVEGHIIPGDWDLLTILHSKNVSQILEKAVNQFEGVQGVSKTETLIARQYFHRIQDETVSVGTYVPQYAFDQLKDSKVLGTQSTS
ncbi:MAG: Lrp/AsnC family transcriptional regulator [Candidatus Bathyarchaeia archaeon]|jgi:DNA-binding Lrp family transcriptional regulator